MYRGLSNQLDDLNFPKWRDTEELTSKIERLENELGRRGRLLRSLEKLCGKMGRIKARSEERSKERVVMVVGGAGYQMAVQRWESRPSRGKAECVYFVVHNELV